MITCVDDLNSCERKSIVPSAIVALRRFIKLLGFQLAQDKGELGTSLVVQGAVVSVGLVGVDLRVLCYGCSKMGNLISRSFREENFALVGGLGGEIPGVGVGEG